MTTRPVFGFTPAGTTAHAVVDRILQTPDAVRLVVTPNVDHVARLRRSAAFRDAYRSAAIVLCDGFPVHAYARLHAHDAQRVTGCDVITELMRNGHAVGSGHRLFFAVDQEATASMVMAWAREHGLEGQVACTVPSHGFASDPARRASLASEIGAHRTTLLVMAVGAPQSEIFVDRMRTALPPCWAICVGQAVKIALGLVRRAPPAARHLRLEWLWRLAQEPRRLGRRYALGGFDFLLAVTEDLLDDGRTLLGPEL